MLPREFRKVRLELAREPGRPAGDARYGYDLLIPLDGDGRIDGAAWRANRDLTRIRRFRSDEADQIGKLGRRPGGAWYFDYHEGDADDEAGFRFGDEAFVPGEYVSLRERDGEFHTFRVVSVESP